MLEIVIVIYRCWFKSEYHDEMLNPLSKMDLTVSVNYARNFLAVG